MPTKVVEWEEQPGQEHTIVDPVTGLPLRMSYHTVVDACRDCGGSGQQAFATYTDMRNHVLAKRAQEQAEEIAAGRFEVGYPEMQYTGRRPCARCNATGKYPGDGGMTHVRMSLDTTIELLPPTEE